MERLKDTVEEKKSIITRQAVGFDIRVTWLAILKMYNPLAQEFGLTTSMGFVLLNIHEEKGTGATKIAPLLGMEPRSMSRMLKKLEKQEFIYRKRDPADKRSVRIHLTKKGLEGKAVAMEYVKSFNEKIRKRVSEEKLQMFFDILEEIYQIAEENKINT